MVELLKVDVSTKWLVHMIHGQLSHLKQPGSASGGVGKMDGMSIVNVATYSCAPQGREGGGAPAAFSC